jgi:hypothetical protein
VPVLVAPSSASIPVGGWTLPSTRQRKGASESGVIRATHVPGCHCNLKARPGVCDSCGIAAGWQIEDA